MSFPGAAGRRHPGCRLAPALGLRTQRPLEPCKLEEGVCPGWGLVTFRAASVFPWKRRYLSKQVGVAPRQPRSSALRSHGRRHHFARPTASARVAGPEPRVAAGRGGGRGALGALAGRTVPLRAGLGRERALAPNPVGPGGGEPTGLFHIQNLEAGGDRESPKLMQVS